MGNTLTGHAALWSMVSVVLLVAGIAAMLWYLLQIAMGVVTAHYAVEGRAFFGLPLAEVLPYVVSRTVHTQVGIFWVATAWLAAGLYIAPLLSGREPRRQKLGVDLLFWALIVVVAGSTSRGGWATCSARAPTSASGSATRGWTTCRAST